jgi:hypothetical protein
MQDNVCEGLLGIGNGCAHSMNIAQNGGADSSYVHHLLALYESPCCHLTFRIGDILHSAKERLHLRKVLQMEFKQPIDVHDSFPIK